MIKKILKGTGIVIGTSAFLAGAFAGHEWYAEKPFFFNNYLNREMVKFAFKDPETLSSLGFLESLGIKGHNAHLDDVDPKNSEEMFKAFQAFGEGLDQYPDEDLDPNQLISKKVVKYLTDLLTDAEPFKYHYYPANQMFGIQSGFPSFMESTHQVNTLEDAEHYISRLSQLERKFTQYLIDLRLREEAGVIPPKFVIQRVLEQMRDFIGTPVEENILYTSLEEKLSKLEDVTDEEKQVILTQAVEQINGSVTAGYNLFIDYFAELETKAGDDHGFWQHPRGDEAYQLALRLFTTTDYTPEYIHNLGLQEVDRIQGEILTILETLGFDTSVGYTDAMAAFTEDPKFYYEDSDEGRAQILADYQTILDEINEGINGAFNVRPKAGMEVVRIPEFKEKTSAGAYYQGPSLDGTRPGRFFANLYDIKATPKFGMRTLAYHEGIPGHHFQIAIAMELEGMPFIRRFAPFTAYSEGWALYAEQVAYEQGFQENPEDNIGRLVAELFRAVRLVVDTGMHHKRWTREEGIDYMFRNTGMAMSDVVAEIERYLVMPGQATAYKVGMIKILELRAYAQEQLQEDFDIREFHDVVLKNGGLPLSLLEEVVKQYVADKQTS